MLSSELLLCVVGNGWVLCVAFYGRITLIICVAYVATVWKKGENGKDRKMLKTYVPDEDLFLCKINKIISMLTVCG